MSEPQPDPALASWEAELRRLAPRAGRLDRDAILFEAGRASAGSLRVWQVTTAALSLAVVVLATLLGARLGPSGAGRVPPPPAPAPAVEPEPSEAAPPPAFAARDRLFDQVFHRGLDGLPELPPEETPLPPRPSFD